MPLSMYQVAAPTFQRMLTALSAVLDKAAEHARSEGIDPAEYVNDRLAPDMFPLVRQVQIATDHAKGAMARLAGREVPRFEDTEASFEELKQRIARTLEFVSSVETAELDGAEDREITLTLRSGSMAMNGQTYLLHFALANFYFHVTTAYAILRHRGVPLGKTDYIGRA